MCCSAEHFRAAAACGAAPRWNALQPVPPGDAAAASTCPMCGFQVPESSLWRCSACQAVCCTCCMPAATAPVYDLSAALLLSDDLGLKTSAAASAAAAPDLGEWPSYSDSVVAVPIWFCWTGDNPLPAYLSLCMESFARRAAPDGRFRVHLVRARDVEQLLCGQVHPAYDYLSLVHRADYLRCELLHRYGGLYCDVDTICVSDLSAPLQALRSRSAVLCAPSLLFDLGLNVGLCRRDSLFTRSWRRALRSRCPLRLASISCQPRAAHAKHPLLSRRLDVRLDALREFRFVNDDPREDALQWDEILRDIVVPLSYALVQLRPDDLAFSLHALHWCPDAAQAPYTPQGFDPLALSPSADEGAQRQPPEGADVVVLNNNQYAASFKAATREEILASACTLSRWLARAVV